MLEKAVHGLVGFHGERTVMQMRWIFPIRVEPRFTSPLW